MIVITSFIKPSSDRHLPQLPSWLGRNSCNSLSKTNPLPKGTSLSTARDGVVVVADVQGFLTRIPSRVDAFPHVFHGTSYEDAAGVGSSPSRRRDDRTRAGRRDSKDRPPARPCARKGPTWPTALNASAACIPAAGARWRVQTLVMKRAAMLDHGSSRGERRGPRCDPRIFFLPPGRSGVCFSRNRSAPAPTKILASGKTQLCTSQRFASRASPSGWWRWATPAQSQPLLLTY